MEIERPGWSALPACITRSPLLGWNVPDDRAADHGTWGGDFGSVGHIPARHGGEMSRTGLLALAPCLLPTPRPIQGQVSDLSEGTRDDGSSMVPRLCKFPQPRWPGLWHSSIPPHTSKESYRGTCAGQAGFPMIALGDEGLFHSSVIWAMSTPSAFDTPDGLAERDPPWRR